MKTNIIVVIIGSIFFLLVGIKFTFSPGQTREYYFKMYREGIQRIGIFTSWIDKYPGEWFFRFFGLLSLGASLILIIILFKRLTS